MNDPRIVLMGVDLLPGGELTEGCRAAADFMLRFVRRSQCQVVLVHSTVREQYWDPLKRGLRIVSEGISDAGRATIDGLAAEIRDAGGTTEVVYAEDKPYLAITREAVQREADVVITGKHSSYETDARKLGNVARRILHYCPCPVLVVNADHVTLPTQVLAATDLTPVGARAVQAAAYVATASEAQLHVVHAYQFSMEDQIDPGGEREGGYEALHEEHRAAAQAEIREELQGTGWEETAEVHVGCGPPDTIVLEAVEALKPELVVMGTVSRGGIAGFLTGNTAERLLDKIPASILAVKPDDFETPVKV